MVDIWEIWPGEMGLGLFTQQLKALVLTVDRPLGIQRIPPPLSGAGRWVEVSSCVIILTQQLAIPHPTQLYKYLCLWPLLSFAPVKLSLQVATVYFE